MPINRHSAISLRPVDDRIAVELQKLTVLPPQTSYVASNLRSLQDAASNGGSWLRAVFANDSVIGLLLVFDPTLPGAIAKGPMKDGDVGLWRFMIDGRYQGRGFGRQALHLLCSELRGWSHASRLISSFVPGAGGPEGFYLAYGFAKTGNMRADATEVEIALELR